MRFVILMHVIKYNLQSTLQLITKISLCNGNSTLEPPFDFKKSTILEIRNDTDPTLTPFYLLQAFPISPVLYTAYGTFPITADTAQQLTI